MTLEVVSRGGTIWGWLEVPQIHEWNLRPGLPCSYYVPQAILPQVFVPMPPPGCSEAEHAAYQSLERERHSQLQLQIMTVHVCLWANDGAQPRLVFAAGDHTFDQFCRLSVRVFNMNA